MKLKKVTVLIALLFTGCFILSMPLPAQEKERSASPRIINIINFIRQTDYRVENADSLLFETVHEQIKLLNKYGFPGTFLFQYDALINPKYQELMKSELSEQCEIGAWWEITQPHVEDAGIKWRGEHSWVSHANIAFTTGYTRLERKKLVDVYMTKFKEIYGYYPKSVGSWFIDSYTLEYMYEKYGIVASCNCKDQVGTDGYTLWGGYWNQAYYPSKVNAYMPAQNAQSQIPVPIFRMLGSDPIYQYDAGLGNSRQGVISLEPVYKESGMDERWIRYYLESIVNQPSLAFNYAQAGQENSFTWKAMKLGLARQFHLFDSLSRNHKIQIETLEHSGRWFKEHFTVTPATAVIALQDIRDEGRKTVWFNSRYYRVNLLWENKSFRFRDIHLFDEKFKSAYYEKEGIGSQFFYYTLPVVDGFMWSTTGDRAGLRIMKIKNDGSKEEIRLNAPVVTEPSKDRLQVECKDENGNAFKIVFREDRFDVSCKPKEKGLKWMLELKTAEGKELPFQSIGNKQIKAEFQNYKYEISCLKGSIENGSGDSIFRLIPAKNELSIDCTNK
ncbi:hypothetical protein [Parabacteroides sp. Marseille-P3160]|uniref:hypothetical protein n=1 Tax=Parabacteroides sp. Marseille-P3160 TaxID=1917887 RepID=UPI0009BAD02C